MFRFFYKNNYHSSDTENHYLSKSNPFYTVSREAWTEMLQLPEDVTKNPEAAILQYSPAKYRQYRNLGELMYMLSYLLANAFAKEKDETFIIATEIFDKKVLRSLNEQDRRYFLIYITFLMIDHFNELPDCFTELSLFKPKLKKVHNTLQTIFPMDLDTIDFKTVSDTSTIGKFWV